MGTTWAGAFGFAALVMAVPVGIFAYSFGNWLLERSRNQRLKILSEMDPEVAKIILAQDA